MKIVVTEMKTSQKVNKKMAKESANREIMKSKKMMKKFNGTGAIQSGTEKTKKDAESNEIEEKGERGIKEKLSQLAVKASQAEPENEVAKKIKRRSEMGNMEENL